MNTQLTILDNGFRIVTHYMPHVETVSMGVWVGAGSRFEKPSQNGIAHFLEHMAFKGTSTRSAFDIVQQIEGVGGDLNAATSQDVTYYHASLLKQHTALGIQILADILQNSIFLEEEIEKERNVVLQEIDQTNDTPDDVVFDHLQEVAFPDQPLGRPILGPKAHVKSFTKEMLKDFINDHYVPQKMVFSAAGNLQHEKIVESVKKEFSFKTIKEGIDPEASVYEGGYSHIYKELEQQHFVLGFEGTSLTSTNFYVAQCYSNLLGGGMSSRLFQEVREKRGLVYGISSFSSSYIDTGLFGVYTGTSEEKAEEIIKIIFQEIENTAHHVPSEEVERSKNQLRAHILMAQENTSYWASSLARQTLVFGKPCEVSEILSRIDFIDSQQISSYASSLVHSKPSLAFIGPRRENLFYKKDDIRFM